MKDVYGALSHTIKKISIDQGLSWSKKDQKKKYIERESKSECSAGQKIINIKKYGGAFF